MIRNRFEDGAKARWRTVALVERAECGVEEREVQTADEFAVLVDEMVERAVAHANLVITHPWRVSASREESTEHGVRFLPLGDVLRGRRAVLDRGPPAFGARP